MANPTSDQKVVITGGGSGIGLATAVMFAKAGAKVIIGGRDLAKLQTAATEQPNIQPLAVNVADRISVQTFIQQAEQQLGHIDILVNAAGINIKNRTMANMTPEQWDEVLAINTTGAYNAMYFALPGMRARQSGLIVNISSVAGKRALKLGGIAYDASKFAMTALGTAVGLEEAPNQIRVTNIYPGEVDTPILKHRPSPLTDDHRARILQPEDVASAILFLSQLPVRAHIPELVIKPLSQEYC